MAKNILFLKGGGKDEHDVSLVTAEYLKQQIPSQYNILEVILNKDQEWEFIADGKTEKCEISFNGELVLKDSKHQIDLVIPCFHGYPGETGHIQSYLEMINIPFIGCGAEASLICFNKVLTKLWLEKVDIPITPFLILNNSEDKKEARDHFFDEHKNVFVKASNQGSSVGCYPVKTKSDLDQAIKNAFQFSKFVILEKLVTPRELEISVYNYQEKVHASWPCEINCPDKFYSYDEKYSQASKTSTVLKADIPAPIVEKIQKYAIDAFNALNLEQFCRMDFFLVDETIYLNEINTFPGMTPISMFPKMIIEDGIEFKDFITYHIDKSLR